MMKLNETHFEEFLEYIVLKLC